MKKGLLVSILCASSFSFSPITYSSNYESGMKSGEAYGAMLNYSVLIKSLMESPNKISQANSQAELQQAVERIDSRVSIIERVGREVAGCVSEKYNSMLSREIGSKYDFKTAEEMVDRALAKANEAKSLYPAAEIRIKQASLKRQADIAEAQRLAEIAQSKLVQEQKEIAELEESVRIQRIAQEQLQAAEQKRRQLQAEQASYGANSNSSSTPSSSNKPYIGEPGYSSGLNTRKSGDGYIKSRRVVCTSKNAHDKQIDLLVNDQKRYAPGCFGTPENQNANLVKSSWGECIVQRISDQKRLWLDCGDFKYW